MILSLSLCKLSLNTDTSTVMISSKNKHSSLNSRKKLMQYELKQENLFDHIPPSVKRDEVWAFEAVDDYK